jgi:hypothetical protein
MQKIFYSWQRDLPNKTNRGLIGDALESAVKELRRDPEVEIEPVIDRDVAGTPGSPDIAHTIFAKIKEAEVFVGDVSIINNGVMAKPTPNPNVLLELGYAIGVLGPERVIMVLNAAHGGPELLPFDLRQRIAVVYTLPEESEDRPSVRRDLANRLEGALRTVFAARDTILTGMTELDNQIFAEMCDETLRRDYKFVQRGLFLPLREKYGKEEFDESVRMLDAKGHIKGSWMEDGLIYGAIVLPESFDQYARRRVKDYKEIKARVARRLVEDGRLSSADISKEVGAPHMLIRLIYQVLESEGLLNGVSGDHTVWADEVSPELGRLLRKRSV